MKKKQKRSCCWDLRAKIILRLQNKADEFSRLRERAQRADEHRIATAWAIKATMLRREAVEEVLKVRVR